MVIPNIFIFNMVLSRVEAPLKMTSPPEIPPKLQAFIMQAQNILTIHIFRNSYFEKRYQKSEKGTFLDIF